MRPTSFDLTESNGWNAHEIGFHGRAYCAGVNGVIPHVGAVVNARDNQIRFVVQQTCQRYVNAISWRSSHVPEAVV